MLRRAAHRACRIPISFAQSTPTSNNTEKGKEGEKPTYRRSAIDKRVLLSWLWKWPQVRECHDMWGDLIWKCTTYEQQLAAVRILVPDYKNCPIFNPSTLFQSPSAKVTPFEPTQTKPTQIVVVYPYDQQQASTAGAIYNILQTANEFLYIEAYALRDHPDLFGVGESIKRLIFRQLHAKDSTLQVKIVWDWTQWLPQEHLHLGCTQQQ
eukprot:TRINITY_DN55526_c0_g1_i1.p1 TRINITY_DN55526_c0_g1~~TRINITY_DN55526_c0_g1_i1.p1  ORF type:complete len:209 (+),score=14.73 TRINITY_DN55526_c0_g1_i1:27-653(+)